MATATATAASLKAATAAAAAAMAVMVAVMAVMAVVAVATAVMEVAMRSTARNPTGRRLCSPLLPSYPRRRHAPRPSPPRILYPRRR